MTDHVETPKPKRKHKVDTEIAIRMWNEGKSLREISTHFPGAGKWNVRSALARGQKSGAIARRGIYHPPQPLPPMAALWQEL